MENADSPAFRIHQDNGQAISGLNCEQNARSAGDETVADGLFVGRLSNVVDEVRMNLAQSDRGPKSSAIRAPELPEEGVAVACDCCPRILLGETEVEAGSTVNTGAAALAGAETVDQPRDAGQRTGMENGELVFLRTLGRHESILATIAGLGSL